MLRDKSLIPLSRQHQHTLALCVRVDRAQPIRNEDSEAWQSEIEREFQQEVRVHFSAEERILFPAAREFPELGPLVEELAIDHACLREQFSQAEERLMTIESLVVFAQQLSTHIRKEERHLFERLQQLMTSQELAGLGAHLEAALKDSAESCLVPSETTRLRPKN
jgi:hemerythrin-like domain-containing protein